MDAVERSIYADAPGTGKTATTLRWLVHIDARESLIVAPLAVIRHWERECERWAPRITTFICTGTAKHRQEAREAFGAHIGPKAIITNYETLRGDSEQWVQKAGGWDAFVCDEAHRLKNRKALVFKAAAKVARRSHHLALVTGTPILNRADELWALLHLIDSKHWSSYWRWVQAHFVVEQTTFYGRTLRPVTVVHDLLPGHEEKIRAELGDLLTQRPITELLPDMPEVVETSLEVDLSPPERKAYQSMTDRFWLEVDGKVIVASNEVSKITRLRQLASDFSNLDDERGPGAKVLATADLLSDRTGERAIVLCAYKGTVYQLIAELQKLDIIAMPFTGDQSREDRDMAVQWFKADKVQVIVGTIAAMGEGVDGLQVANHVVMLDRDWTPARNEQAVARIRRSGQEADHIFVTNVVAKDTIDATVAAALDAKQSVIDAILGRSLEVVISGRGL